MGGVAVVTLVCVARSQVDGVMTAFQWFDVPIDRVP